MRSFLYIVIALSTLFGGLMVVGWFIQPDRASGASESASSTTQRYVLSYTPDEIVLEYDRNTVRADGQFKGKVFKVLGQLTSINTDVSGTPYVTMKTTSGNYVEPIFRFKAGQKGVSALNKGQTIQLTCVGDGDVVKVPVARDCEF